VIILIFLGLIFVGYSVGRISHIIAHGRHIQSIHHWVYGLVIILLGLLFLNSLWRITAVGVGAGFVISDLNDMLKLRFYGVEKFEKQKFWGIK